MKVIHITTYDKGGAGKACARIHKALLGMGIDSHLLVLKRNDMTLPRCTTVTLPVNTDFYSRLKRKGKRLLKETGLYRDPMPLEEKYLQNRPPNLEIFSFPVSGIDLSQNELVQQADVIHLHWTARLLDYPTFFSNCKKKMVWTLHDMNPFTGGCHYSSGCMRFTENCNVCPQLKNTPDPEYSNKNYLIKSKAYWLLNNLTVVAPSEWLMKLSLQSALFRGYQHEHIDYPCDGNIFRNLDKNNCRDLFSLAKDIPVFLYVADYTTKRKGYHLLTDAVRQLPEGMAFQVAVAGEVDQELMKHNKIKHLGAVNDERLMGAAYSACDYTIVSSLEDNSPNVIIESLLCGTPVLAFAAGGIPEMIQNEVNGFTSAEFSVESMKALIMKAMGNIKRFDALTLRTMASHRYNSADIALKYIDVYSK